MIIIEHMIFYIHFHSIFENLIFIKITCMHWTMNINNFNFFRKII